MNVKYKYSHYSMDMKQTFNYLKINNNRIIIEIMDVTYIIIIYVTTFTYSVIILCCCILDNFS